MLKSNIKRKSRSKEGNSDNLGVNQGLLSGTTCGLLPIVLAESKHAADVTRMEEEIGAWLVDGIVENCSKGELPDSFPGGEQQCWAVNRHGCVNFVSALCDK